jgi:hypothetical protein
MADPLNLRAVNALIARLQGITVAGGYNTNAGARVFHGRRNLEKAQLPAIVVFEGDETAVNSPGTSGAPPDGTTDSMLVSLTLVVEGYAVAEPTAEGPALSLLKADIKKAALVYDAPSLADVDGLIGKLAYSGANPLLRPDGSAVEGVQIQFTARLIEGYGNPYAAR